MRVERYGRAVRRWARLLVRHEASEGIRVFYGHDELPAPGEAVAGGSGKFQQLAQRFPNSPDGFSLLYLGSTFLPRDLAPLLWLAGRRRIPIAVNQSGVAYPGWAGADTESLNRPFGRALHAADHVLYQSEFCRRSAETFLGVPGGSWEVLYNAVDVHRFTPGAPLGEGPVLILGGDQTQAYRVEAALHTLALLPEARLIVTGRIVSDPRPLVRELGLGERVELTGRYTQAEAPSLFRRAHVLLHTKVQDPCPTTVIEAMACGVPVVYAASGGTVELVGDEAGIGVPHPESWKRDQPPDPEALADAVRRVLGDRERYAAAARERAVARFTLEPWLDRHAELFSELVSLRGRTSRAG